MKKTGFISDFKKFINRGNVVDMAVGVAVAGAFSAIVSAFTAAFISPLVSFITGGVNLKDLIWVIRKEVLDAEGAVVTPSIQIAWGAFMQAIIDFLIIAFVMFIIIRYFTKLTNKAKELSVSEKEKAEAAKAEAEAKAKTEAEKQAAEAAQAEAERLAAEALAREKETVALLREIRDSLNKG